mmetsp:Transcript_11957/g.33658  ORF Transcript_11957/g.33658 Transcript_11957/m.33658 type:complete len:107 (+) Transcript_11957:186-506(+)
MLFTVPTNHCHHNGSAHGSHCCPANWIPDVLGTATTGKTACCTVFACPHAEHVGAPLAAALLESPPVSLSVVGAPVKVAPSQGGKRPPAGLSASFTPCYEAFNLSQ